MKFCGLDLCFGISAVDGAIRLADDDDAETLVQSQPRVNADTSPEFLSFLAQHPEYNSAFLDQLRQSDFERLDNLSQRSCYLDYTGGALYPESLVRNFADQLAKNVYGNPHSTNPSSQLSSRANAAAKKSGFGLP